MSAFLFTSSVIRGTLPSGFLVHCLNFSINLIFLSLFFFQLFHRVGLKIFDEKQVKIETYLGSKDLRLPLIVLGVSGFSIHILKAALFIVISR